MKEINSSIKKSIVKDKYNCHLSKSNKSKTLYKINKGKLSNSEINYK